MLGSAYDAASPRPADRLRVLIVTPIRLYREGLALALARDDGFDVAGAVASARSAAEALERLTVDLVVLDASTEDARTLTRTIAAQSGPRVVALAIPDTEESVIACAEAGISAYVPADASLEELSTALRSAACGETYCSARVAGGLMRRIGVLSAERPGFPHASPLTAREEQIVELIDEGLSNKEIAQRLYIEVATVKNHVHNVLEKLNVSRRAQAAARMRAVRNGG